MKNHPILLILTSKNGNNWFLIRNIYENYVKRSAHYEYFLKKNVISNDDWIAEEVKGQWLAPSVITLMVLKIRIQKRLLSRFNLNPKNDLISYFEENIYKKAVLTVQKLSEYSEIQGTSYSLTFVHA